MTQLTKYEAARSALAEAKAVDEVKDLRDKSAAMAMYARQAKDTELIAWATEIKVRAERRMGEMLIEAGKTGHRATKGKPVEMSQAATLSELGVTRSDSSRWQKLAEIPKEHFETAVAAAKDTAGEVTTAHMLREAKKLAEPESRPRVAAKPERAPEPPQNDRASELERRVTDLEDELSEARSMLASETADNLAIGKIIDADDKLAEAAKEIRRLTSLVASLEDRIRGLMNEKNEAIRDARSWQRKAQRLMKAAA